MKTRFRFSSVLLAMWLGCASLASAQPRHSPELSALPPKPYTQDEARAYLEKFRHAWFGSDVAVAFNLVHYPRRGDEVVYPGAAWSAWGGEAPVTRVELLQPAADKSAKPELWQWVLQSGPTPHIWVLAPGTTAAVEVPPAQWRKPFLPGVIYTPFDLMAPFLYWADFKYNGTDRVLSRGVDVYTMNPPADQKAAGLLPVKVYIDRELDALVCMQELDAQGKVALQFDLDKVAKVQGRWMLKSCKLTDEVKNDYDMFVVQSAAVPSEAAPFKLDPAIFTAAGLTKPVPALPKAAWTGL